MVVEIIGIVGFAGLISAWAVWIYPALRGEKNVSPKTWIFAQGECSYGLLPCDKDAQRIAEWKATKKQEGEEKVDKDEIANKKVLIHRDSETNNKHLVPLGYGFLYEQKKTQ